jgi:hypothetical protein
MPMSATVPTGVTSKLTFHIQILCRPNLGRQIIIAGKLAPCGGAILYLLEMAIQLMATNNIFMIRVCREEVTIKRVKLGYAAWRPQFYDFDAYLQNGSPNFTNMMAISAAETQLYSLDKTLRCVYPYFGHILGIFAPSCTYLGYLWVVLGAFCGWKCWIFHGSWWLCYDIGSLPAFFYRFFF